MWHLHHLKPANPERPDQNWEHARSSRGGGFGQKVYSDKSGRKIDLLTVTNPSDPPEI